MQLREEILAVHSKEQTNKIIDWVGDSQKRFDELFHLFLHDEYRMVQRSAWAVSYCVIQHPALIKKHYKSLLSNLHKPNLHDAVKRNTMRLLQHINIPERFQGNVMDICFQYISSPTEAVAIKAFSLTVLQNLSRYYPEIIPEIKVVIEDRWEHETAAFRSRAKKFLKASDLKTKKP